MDSTIDSLLDFYRKNVSEHIKEYSPSQVTDHIKRIASYFAPGDFYFYIINFQNLEMEFVHPNVEKITGIKAEEFNVKNLLGLLTSDDLKRMTAKEKYASDFLFNFLKPEELTSYKVVYLMNIIDRFGKEKKLLHQASTLKVSSEGMLEHVLGVHIDVTYLGVFQHNSVSFINMEDGKSYWNLDPSLEKFDPDVNQKTIGSMNLTDREVHIIELLAKGFSAKMIAEKLDIAFSTVNTHKKNILKKTDCSNTTEVVARFMMESMV